jgi:DNA-directed RNA polymerase specialized sigma24 family protein
MIGEDSSARPFGGLSRDEIARHFGVSLTTAERRRRLARAWLFRYFQGNAA